MLRTNPSHSHVPFPWTDFAFPPDIVEDPLRNDQRTENKRYLEATGMSESANRGGKFALWQSV